MTRPVQKPKKIPKRNSSNRPKGNSVPKKKRRKFKKRKGYEKRQAEIQVIGRERIVYLLNRAQEIHHENQTLANRYVHIARKLAMAVRIQIPSKYKRSICHSCKKLMVPGSSMRFRTVRKKKYGTYLACTCLNCGHITRYIMKGRALSKSKRLDTIKTEETLKITGPNKN
jgi:ribonuclease P protein subunit RPR2